MDIPIRVKFKLWEPSKQGSRLDVLESLAQSHQWEGPMRQRLAIMPSDQWEPTIQKVRDRMRIAEGALTLIDELDEVITEMHELTVAKIVSVHVMPGKLVSKRLVLRFKRNTTLWVGASRFTEIMEISKDLRARYGISKKAEHQFLSVMVGQLEGEICWNRSQPTSRAWLSAKHESWSKLDPCTCSEGWFGAERYRQAVELRSILRRPVPAVSAHILEALRQEGVVMLRQTLPPFLIRKVNEQRCFNKSLLKNHNDRRFKTVQHPLLSCSSILPLVFHPYLEQIAANSFGVHPGVGGVNLRASVMNDLEEAETQLFHSDKNHARFLKFFIYLTPVTVESGPFTYVNGSHNQRFYGWDTKYRWTYEEIERQYGQDRILHFEGEIGDVIVADTTGFHRGTKVISQEREMLTVNYQLAHEYNSPPMSISKHDVETLGPSRRHLADFLKHT